MAYRPDGSWFDTDDYRDVAHALRVATERPLGKMTYQIVDQRAFDAALERLFSLADIEPLGAQIMKFVCERDILKTAISCVIGRTKGVKIPILSHIRLTAEAEHNRLKLMAHDLQSSSEVEIAAEISEAGSAAIPADQLSRLVGGFYSGSQVSVQCNAPRAKICSGRSTYHLPVMDAGEMPEMLSAEGGLRFDLTQGQVKRLFGPPSQVVANDQSRPAYCGVNIHRADGVLAGVGTNGFRFIRTLLSDIETEEFKPVLIPEAACAEFQRIVSESGCEFYLTDNLVTMVAGDRVFSTRIIDAIFPGYEHIIPNNDKAAIVFDTETLDCALARLAVVAAEKAEPVAVLSWQGKLERVNIALRSQQGEGDESIECEGALPDAGRISLKISDLRLILDAVDSDRVAIHFGDDAGCVFRISNPADAGFLALCVPVH